MTKSRMPKAKREGLASAAVKRQLVAGAGLIGEEKARVSREAVAMAKAKLEKLLKQLAKQCAKTLGDRKTLTKKHLEMAVADMHICGLPEEALDHKARAGEARGLAQASVLHAFGEHRSDAEFKKALLSFAEAVLALLGDRAAKIAMAAKRHTVQEQDVVLALQFLH